MKQRKGRFHLPAAFQSPLNPSKWYFFGHLRPIGLWGWRFIGRQRLPDWTTFHTFTLRKRRLYFYRDYFRDFYDKQAWRVQKKILWTLEIIEKLDRIPEIYFKTLTGADGLYEIRIQVGGDIYRVFCFFDDHDLIVVGHGFQKKTKKTPLPEIERAKTLKKNIMKRKNLTKLSDFVEEKVGRKGSIKRNAYDRGLEAFTLGVLLQQARREKGLTQEQLADLAGTNKSYISKLEKDLKDVRFSTLQRIVEEGLGGQLQIAIKV